MNVSRRQPRWNSSQAKPMLSLVPEEYLDDVGDDIDVSIERDQQPKDPEPTGVDAEPYTVREAMQATGLSRHRLYKMIHDFEISAYMSPFGRQAWLIPFHEVRRLMLMDLDE